MSDEIDVSQDVAAPAAPETPRVPKSDAEAQQMESQAPEAPKVDEPKDKQRNRTTEYIGRLKDDNRVLRERLASFESAQPQKPAAARSEPAEGKPTLESCNYDLEDYAEKLADWKADQRDKASADKAQKDEAQKSHRQTLETYQSKVDAFTEAHPDFEEVVGSIDPKYLTNDLQMAILAHEKGPELAYHLAMNEDDLFDIASRRPELYGDALNRLSKRLTAAPSQPEPPEPPAIARAVEKPISKAPAPTPTVSGRSPAVVDESKLTDEQWLKREQERRRKR